MKTHVLSWAFMTTLLWAAPSWAVISNPGNIVDFKGDNICRIMINDQGINSICSGSLIRPDLVLTANHCVVGPSARVEVGCGYQGFDPQNIVTVKTGKGNVVVQNVSFKETSLGKFTSVDTELDQALIKLDRKFSIAPLKIGLDSEFDGTRPCLLSGYGINKSGTAGVQLSAWVPIVQIAMEAYRFDNVFESTMPDPGYAKPRVDEMAATSIESTMQGVSLLAGDSGGPFLCYNKQGELMQLGISNSILRQSEMKSGHLFFTVNSFAMKISPRMRKTLGL
ncbi:trypsin-like serine protease [Bdellovibrio sp. KM01]|uniref:trypsin-like serine protease n=1 Tax=Bdellovibrio sp. KM01 TaxID=2748865 RepID=UPI0015EAB1C7|nr:trypsin-like serine protease [Bdellovibrio sp. KM01]QLY24524.1 trypsin-like serine protease [Bdellovibrio sp. KM01]